MQPIDPAAVEARLQEYAGRTVYLHLETTNGAYTENTFGAFIRNAAIRFQRAGIRGTGPYRAGIETDAGFVFAEGLTHWEVDSQGRLLLAGYDREGQLTVALELSRTPFPMGPGPSAGGGEA